MHPGSDPKSTSFHFSGSASFLTRKPVSARTVIKVDSHAYTHIIPRLQKVIDGADPFGITDSAEWKGGGGFRFFNLAPSLLERDKWGNWIINQQYNAAMLSQALCKLEGFRYAPSDTLFWQQGHCTERDFIYVTTQNLTPAQLDDLSEDRLGHDRLNRAIYS